jgi:NADH-quinone oxidoreductase subunit H
VTATAGALAAATVVGATLLALVYLAAVLDGWFADRVSGRHRAPASVLGAPARTAALLLLRGRTTTERPDAEAWALAPALLAGLAAVSVAVVPIAPAAAAADLDAGLALYVAALAVVMVAVFLHGWAPNSPFPLFGAYRFVAVALSYQVPLALVLLATALPAESLGLNEIVLAQEGAWNVVRQPLGLPIFLATGLGVAFWGPLALPDAQDIAGGTRSEASAAALLLWRTARLAILVSVAAMAATAFLGGWLGPWLPGPVWLGVKTIALLVPLLAARHMFARVRTESFVWFGWVVLIPLALVDVFLSGILLL